MANEITANIRIQLSNAGLSDDFNPGRVQITQTTQLMFARAVSISTTEATVTITGITTPKVCYLYNLDGTNYCEWGTTTTDYPIRLYPYGNGGIPNVLTLNTTKTTFYMKANTAATRVLIAVYEL